MERDKETSTNKGFVGNLKKASAIGAVAARFILCPGDDILAVTSVVSVGLENQEIRAAILPRDEIGEFLRSLKIEPENNT